MTIDDFLDKAIDRANDKCKQCFCNDLCLFILMKKGQVTTCEDFQDRVNRVIDREIDKRFHC